MCGFGAAKQESSSLGKNGMGSLDPEVARLVSTTIAQLLPQLLNFKVPNPTVAVCCLCANAVPNFPPSCCRGLTKETDTWKCS